MKEKARYLLEEFKKIGRGIKNLRFFKFSLLRRFFEMFSRREKIALVILILVLIADLATVASRFYLKNTVTVAAYGSSYTEAEVGEPQFINPILAQSQTDKDLANLVYAGLYKFDAQGGLIPDLADGGPQIDPSGKIYTVKLKPGLKWSDGQPLTAEDVVFTVQTLQNPDFKSPLRHTWQNVTAFKIDDLTVQLKNQAVSAPFLLNLTLGILPEHVWQKLSANQFLVTKLNLQPVGSGPYFVKEILNAHDGSVQSITFESYSNYWQGKPFIDHVKINFYQNSGDALLALHSKEAQGLGLVSFDQKISVDPKTALKVGKLPLYEYQALFFNLDKSHNVLGDPAVRTALAQAVDRNKIIDNIYQGLAFPDFGPLMPGQLGYNPESAKINTYDPENAKKLLDQAGWIADPQSGIRAKGKQRLQFSITTNDFVLNAAIANALKVQLAQIGADVTVNIVPTADLENKYIRPRNFESLLFGIKADADPDPFVFWHSSQAKDPGLNISQYRNTLADQLISAAHNTFDLNKRISSYQQFQTVLATDVPAIFIAQSAFVYEMTPEIKGVTVQQLANPEDRFYDIVHWYIQTKRVFK